MTAKWAVIGVGIFHLVIMLGELFPWGNPLIMTRAFGKLPKPLTLGDRERGLTAMIVHNAGVYNGILGVGLIASAFEQLGSKTQISLLAGVIVAGLFGARTLSVATLAQALLGAAALAIVVFNQ